MSEHEAVGTPASAEAIPEQEQLRRIDRLRELFTLGDAVLEQRGRIREVAEQVAGLVTNDAQRLAIADFAAITDWAMFAPPGAPLPPRTVLAQKEYTREVLIDHRIPYTENIGLLEDKLHKAGLRTVKEAAAADIEEREEEILDVLRDIIHDTEEYKLLAAFDEPVLGTGDQPLDEYWRLVRSAQIRGSIARKHAIKQVDDGNAERLVLPFRQELLRRSRRLDEETVPRPEAAYDEAGAFARARVYLTPRLLATYAARQQRLYPHLAENPDDFEIAYIPAAEDAGVVRKNKDLTGKAHYGELYDAAIYAAEDFCAEQYSGPVELLVVVEAFLAIAFTGILDPRTNGDYMQELEVSVEQTLELLWDRFEMMYDPSDALSGFSEAGELLALLKRPDAHPLNRDWFTGQRTGRPNDWSDVFGRRVQLLTRDRIREEQQETIGVVEAYGPDNARVPLRLLTLGPLSDSLPDIRRDDEVLSLAIKQTGTPYVPGYRAVRYSWEQRTHGFIMDPEGDPYSVCDVPVPLAGREQLARKWRGIGLDGLASSMERATALDVAGLTYLIRSYSDYYVADNPLPFGAHKSLLGHSSTTPQGLYDFGSVVLDGRLQVQCTGSAQFLRQSLEELFGSGCAAIASGYTLDGQSRRISGLQHAQAIFAHDGKQYILDATSAGTIGDGPAWELAPSGIRMEQQVADVPELIESTQPVQTAEVFVDTPLKSDAEQIADLTRSHTEYLKARLGKPTDRDLYDYLAALPEDNPARRSLELLLRIAQDRMEPAALTAAVTYLEQCRTIGPEVRQRFGWSDYPTGFLDQLAQVGRRAGYILGQNTAGR